MKDYIYTDQEIDQLTKEVKVLPVSWRITSPTRVDGQTITQIVDALGENGNKFKLVLRQNKINPSGFCLTLGVYPPNSKTLFHLRRYDGKYDEHTNPIEKEIFYNFHIHIATKRYQVFGVKKEDKYAEITDRYFDYEGALECLFEDCCFKIPENPQLSIV